MGAPRAGAALQCGAQALFCASLSSLPGARPELCRSLPPLPPSPQVVTIVSQHNAAVNSVKGGVSASANVLANGTWIAG
jgi:hypothetical protein